MQAKHSHQNKHDALTVRLASALKTCVEAMQHSLPEHGSDSPTYSLAYRKGLDMLRVYEQGDPQCKGREVCKPQYERDSKKTGL